MRVQHVLRIIDFFFRIPMYQMTMWLFKLNHFSNVEDKFRFGGKLEVHVPLKYSKLEV